jgi:hypothetical protein
MYELWADGQLWADSDGQTLFTLAELASLAAVVESQGYGDVRTVQVAYVVTGDDA